MKAWEPLIFPDVYLHISSPAQSALETALFVYPETNCSSLNIRGT